MKLWRKDSLPPEPKTLSELVTQAEDPKYQKILQGREAKIEIIKIIDSDNEEHVALYDKKVINDYFKTTEKVIIDATFQTAPRLSGQDYLQLLDSMGIKYGRVS